MPLEIYWGYYENKNKGQILSRYVEEESAYVCLTTWFNFTK